MEKITNTSNRYSRIVTTRNTSSLLSQKWFISVVNLLYPLRVDFTVDFSVTVKDYPTLRT